MWQCAQVCLACVLMNWLSDVALQAYLRQAMQGLYTGGCPMLLCKAVQEAKLPLLSASQSLGCWLQLQRLKQSAALPAAPSLPACVHTCPRSHPATQPPTSGDPHAQRPFLPTAAP